MSISALRNQNSLDKLLQQVQKDIEPQGEKKSYVDERLWKPQVDKVGNGYAVIRFLPAPSGEELPWVRLWNHAFQGPTGQWYIENSLTTLNQNDPVSEYNSALWNSGVESDKEIARKQKRKLQYYSNIYVVEDSMNPENNGKVMLYRYGKKIYDKIMEAMQPEFADETPINPFDLWEGANFMLKIRNLDGYRNYDKSEFGESGPLLDDESKMEGVWNSEFKLGEFIDPSKFKTYDELKQKLDKVLALSGGSQPSSTAEQTQLDTAPAPSAGKSSPPPKADDDDNLDFFQKLADED